MSQSQSQPCSFDSSKYSYKPEEFKDSPEPADIEIFDSPGLDLLSTAAISTQTAFEASKMFENSQEVMSRLDIASQEAYQTKSSQNSEPPSQSCQRISEFDLHSLSPDDNSLDNPMDVSVPLKVHTAVKDPQIIPEHVKGLSLNDFFVIDKPSKKKAQKKHSSEKLDKRERNRLAAQKLREKRKQEKHEIKIEIDYWEKRIATVSMELKQLEEEKNKYMALLKNVKLDKNAKNELYERAVAIKEEY